MTRILVCGGRAYADRGRVFQILDAAVERLALTEICEGGAAGADHHARSWAIARSIPCRSFPADWSTFGLSAGPRRNEQMLREFIPNIVIAFPGGPGTHGMVLLARKSGVRVIKIDWR